MIFIEQMCRSHHKTESFCPCICNTLILLHIFAPANKKHRSNDWQYVDANDEDMIPYINLCISVEFKMTDYARWMNAECRGKNPIKRVLNRRWFDWITATVIHLVYVYCTAVICSILYSQCFCLKNAIIFSDFLSLFFLLFLSPKSIRSTTTIVVTEIGIQFSFQLYLCINHEHLSIWSSVFFFFSLSHPLYFSSILHTLDQIIRSKPIRKKGPKSNRKTREKAIKVNK